MQNRRNGVCEMQTSQSPFRPIPRHQQDKFRLRSTTERIDEKKPGKIAWFFQQKALQIRSVGYLK